MSTRKAILLPPRNAYRRWSTLYEQSGRNPLTRLAEEMMDELGPEWGGSTVLDLGCGDGRWARAARDSGASVVVGLDFVAEMLAAARRGTPDLALAAGDIRALPIASASFDAVLLSLALSHVIFPAPVIEEVGRVLKPHGRLFLIDLHPRFDALGLQRSFRDDEGRLARVRWYPHRVAEVERLCQRFGLRIEAQVERGLALDQLAPGSPEELAGQPLLYALSARRVEAV